ncbi:methionyl-tRNA synthetase, beta subunit [Sulfolobus islandicus Y.G.57.14]|jgi:tRNA-binding protein|uniref:Methionine--tRNA ligase n=10 Tax=Saccharolobus islandicus TaxID=43080 RepID=M9U9Q7_SACIS|nr:methionine--tRNA ligase subunit beta [Sulfolobus islandicus]ACP35620.1 methionyl-tRNA synthetase, beta subunit [Sulfolobus islandicus L.S.2.15]ACP38257.1 methionyl-tRNA synthetase, beta subunit [Sulfolobus islandicus M.14.25]ACP45773.1 methionyl-tRNA synthetase, beta subunit [Sulfolobus islandicus Y.G.57.14]ACP48420.1 t-RNA-binding domain protein [Sulfolobus islandicus Y.N.15.51]ACP55503.1 methionyl-tRNA synthetase, beta subunit [Sulfolobus islandicus M.16.27]
MLKLMSSQITIDDFAKLDLRVGIVRQAERIEGTRLLKLMVDLGSEQRQIIAGLGEYYTPDELLNKRIIIIVNLKPRVIRGFESQGMLLAAGCKEDEAKGIKPRIITVDGEVPPGTKIC